MWKHFHALTGARYLCSKRLMLKQIIILLSGLLIACGIIAPVCFAENPWWIRINIPEFKLYLYNGPNLYQIYEIAVGKPETPSPVGDFWIINKIVNPTWYPPGGGTPVEAGPSNPLGKYWLGLNKKGYGIHGNSAPYSIGHSISLGCFRMRNIDVEQLFHLVSPGTLVEITYTTVLGYVDENAQAWLEVFPDIYNRTNQEERVQTALGQLNWGYEPHQKALQKLLSGKKPLKIAVPRVVKIEGDMPGIDAFYWEGSIYISKGILKILQVTANDINDPQFTEYLKLETVVGLTGGASRCYWDPETSAIKFISPEKTPITPTNVFGR